jgi:hypothetical protein
LSYKINENDHEQLNTAGADKAIDRNSENKPQPEYTTFLSPLFFHLHEIDIFSARFI